MFIMRFAMRSGTEDLPPERICTAPLLTCIVGRDKGLRGDRIVPAPRRRGRLSSVSDTTRCRHRRRTSTLPISVAALLLAHYEPVKLAEDLVIVDLLSRGRVSYVVGIGYRDQEFEMFGVERRRERSSSKNA